LALAREEKRTDIPACTQSNRLRRPCRESVGIAIASYADVVCRQTKKQA